MRDIEVCIGPVNALRVSGEFKVMVSTLSCRAPVRRRIGNNRKPSFAPVIVARTATVYAFRPHVGKSDDLITWIAQPRNSPDHLAGHPSQDYQCRRLSESIISPLQSATSRRHVPPTTSHSGPQ